MNRQFVEKSNLPNKEVKLCIVAGDKEIYLGQDIAILKTLQCKDVYEEIEYHPDIQMCYLGNGRIVICPNMYDKYAKEFEKIGLECIRGRNRLRNSYPYDIPYNACIIDKYFIHNLEYTDPILLEEAKKMNLKCINVKQGYTKCNISIVDKNSIITSDKGIQKELEKYFDILYINPDENILLGNMYGFIGGATGLISNNKWAINGSIYNLREYDKVISFLKARSIEVVCLNREKISDIGTIIPIKYE